MALVGPIAMKIASDSMAMLSKLWTLIDWNKRLATLHEGHYFKSQWPFARPWTEIADGDSWKQLWHALKVNGAQSIEAIKVK